MSFEVSICICTFQREELLDRLLGAIDRLQGAPPFEVIVIDNDSAGSAEHVVGKWAAQVSWPITYDVEQVQNISLARNRSFSRARGRWLATIDDDEYPGPGWLAELYSTAIKYRADAVLGPVVPEYPDDIATHMIDAGLFERARHPTGTPVPYMQTRTSNLLLRREAIDRIDGPFDPHYGLTGGGDTRMLEELRAGGGNLIWSDEAEVFETVPVDRATFKWVSKRAYRGAQSYVRVHLALAGNAASRFKRALGIGGRAIVLLAFALVLSLLFFPISRGKALFYWAKACAQVGKCFALLGVMYYEYRVA